MKKMSIKKREKEFEEQISAMPVKDFEGIFSEISPRLQKPVALHKEQEHEGQLENVPSKPQVLKKNEPNLKARPLSSYKEKKLKEELESIPLKLFDNVFSEIKPRLETKAKIQKRKTGIIKYFFAAAACVLALVTAVPAVYFSLAVKNNQFYSKSLANVAASGIQNMEATRIFIRESAVAVTNSKKVKHADTVRLPESKESLEIKGVRILFVTVFADVWEKNDGYQVFNVCTGPGSGYEILGTQKLEHSPGKKDGTVKRLAASFTILLDDLIYDEFTIQYSASGRGANTWYNKNISVAIVFGS